MSMLQRLLGRRDSTAALLEVLREEPAGSPGLGSRVASQPVRQALTLLNWRNDAPEVGTPTDFFLPAEETPVLAEASPASRPVGELLRGLNWSNRKQAATASPLRTAPVRGVPVMVNSVDDVLNQIVWD